MAPAHFAGVQDGCGIFPSFELFTLDAPVGIHPRGSTVSRSTLEENGFSVPPIPQEMWRSEDETWQAQAC